MLKKSYYYSNISSSFEYDFFTLDGKGKVERKGATLVPLLTSWEWEKKPHNNL
jgi:hypothetical protein